MRRDEPCPDGALMHGPPDGAGRCPWCGIKVDSALPASLRYPRSELSETYEQFYDPDYGARGATELRRQRETAVNYY
jgi:hypothetical protein